MRYHYYLRTTYIKVISGQSMLLIGSRAKLILSALPPPVPPLQGTYSELRYYMAVLFMYAGG